jgi:hypothetical protein
MEKYIVTAHSPGSALHSDPADWIVCDTRFEAEFRAERFLEKGWTAVHIRPCGEAKEVSS